MNSDIQYQDLGRVHSAVDTGEETLRLMASLPVPEGLEGRVLRGVLAQQRRGRVLAWPSFLRPENGWMRAAAAAAIVFVVGGGGWGVYSRVQQGQPSRIISMPLHIPAPGSFSGAGAIRTPQTIEGPVLTQPAKRHPLPGKPANKAVSRSAPNGRSNGRASAGQSTAHASAAK
jgi:hypothetical protein